MVEYDPKIIVTFAAGLYKQARTTVAAARLMGLVVGVVVSGLVQNMIATRADLRDYFGVHVLFGCLCVGLGGYIGHYIGHMVGQVRAFSLRLQAQTALCQVSIEENTRKVAGSLAT